MTKRNEQRLCVEFCQKVADTQSDTIKKVQKAFGDEAMGVAKIKFGFNCFKNGRESIESKHMARQSLNKQKPEIGRESSGARNGKPTHNRQGN